LEELDEWVKEADVVVNGLSEQNFKVYLLIIDEMGLLHWMKQVHIIKRPHC
jgi:hypothetical protein